MSGVRRVVSHLPRRLHEAEIPLLSASLAFSTLLALVPFLAVSFVVVYGLTGMDSLGTQLHGLVLSVMKDLAGADATAILGKILRRLAQRTWTLTSALALVLTSLKLFFDMEMAVNRIWLTKPERSRFKRLLVILGFYFLVPFGLAVYAGLRSMDSLQPIFRWNPRLWDIGLCFFAFLMMNRWLPAVRVRWPVAFTGAFVSTVAFFFLQGSFTWLTKKVFIYSKVYGSLAALPLLCLWLLFTWYVVLAGVALAAGLQHPSPRRRGAF